MRRREVLAGLLLAGARAEAQQRRRMYRIAVVHPSASAADMSEAGGEHPYLPAFFRELRRLGYVEGQNLRVERHARSASAENWPERALAVVQSDPDVIFAVSNRMTQHLRAATATIPIVGMTADPVAAGLTRSLARPDGNLTGVVIDAGYEIWDKRLQLLREAVPKLSTVGILAPRGIWESRYGPAWRTLARQAGVALLDPPLDEPVQDTAYPRFFRAMIEGKADGLMVNEAPENFARRRLIVGLAAQARLPTIYPNPEYVALGGLLAYAPDFQDLFRNAARQVVEILNGAKPKDIPFFQSTRLHLILNLTSAKALGLSVPPTLLARADEVIE